MRKPVFSFRLPFIGPPLVAADPSPAQAGPFSNDHDALSSSGADSTFVIDVDSGRTVGTLSDLDGDEQDDAVHDVLKRTDVWFSYHATALEKESRDLAARHAEKGQPRHDLPREGPIEMEVLLEQQAREVLWGWGDRVKRKMRGAVSLETEKIGSNLATARQAVANAAAARDATERQRREITQHMALAPVVHGTGHGERGSGGHSPAGETVDSERHIASVSFWLLMVLLVLADFFANVPVFVELFPANKLVDDAFRQWEEVTLTTSDSLPTWFGMAHLLKRVAIYPESAILAVSVVVLFVFLGHQLGGSLRTLVVLWKHRTEAVSHTASSLWRQARWPAKLSLAGVLVMMAVLFAARAQVLPMAEQRAAQARSALTAMQAELKRYEQRGEVPPTDRVEAEALAVEEVHTRDARVDYARSIDRMNLPIFFLNMVLVLTAVVAGYQREKRRFVVTPHSALELLEEHRRVLAGLNAAHDVLFAQFATRREAAHGAMRAVGLGILRADHLLHADLFRDWQGKAERLRRSVPLFRTENARLRGLDVEDIVAFRTAVQMILPTPEEMGVVASAPPALHAYREEYGQLQARLTELDHVSLGADVGLVPMRPVVQAALASTHPLNN